MNNRGVCVRFWVSVFMFSFCLFYPWLKASSELLLPESDVRISMDLKDANLKDVLKVLSMQSGLNFIASEAVINRTLTLYMDNVPLEAAMDKIFKANNLTYELDTLSNIFLVKDWGKPQIETITRIFRLKYATVSTSSMKEEMASLMSAVAFMTEKQGGEAGTEEGKSGKWKFEKEAGITEIVKKLLSEHGKVIEDFRTNSLIVTDIPSRMPLIAQTIAALDVRVPQVVLEVEMLDVSKNAIDKLGIEFPESLVQLDMTTTSRATSFPFTGTNKAFNSQGWTMGIEDETAGGWQVGDWLASNFGPSLFSVINTQLTLDFLKTLSDTKILARPRILTLNNEPAEIKITTQEAIGSIIVTQGQGTASSTTTKAERIETGTSLRVTPQINEETGEITMFIIPIVRDATTSTFNTNFKDPEERSTKSIVRVRDGETVVIGGLIRHDYSQTETKLPVLGDIPVLGALFRHKDKDKDRERELLVFITPHIVKDTNAGGAKLLSNVRVPEREQNVFAPADRQSIIAGSLNNFEKQ